MAKLLKLRRGTTSQHSSFTGAEGEVTVDTDKEALVVHNGSTAGGFPVARADGTGVTNFTITGELDAATGDFSGDVDVDGTLEADAITVNGTALSTVITGTTVTNATNAAGLTGTPNVTVGVVTAGSLDISGNADIDGTLEADNIILKAQTEITIGNPDRTTDQLNLNAKKIQVSRNNGNLGDWMKLSDKYRAFANSFVSNKLGSIGPSLMGGGGLSGIAKAAATAYGGPVAGMAAEAAVNELQS